MSTGITTVAALAPSIPSGVSAEVENPFDGVGINFDFLGPEFTHVWQYFLGGVWGLVVVAAAFFVLLSVLSLRHIKQENNAQKQEKAKGKVIGAAATLGAAVIVPLLVGAVVFAANAAGA